MSSEPLSSESVPVEDPTWWRLSLREPLFPDSPEWSSYWWNHRYEQVTDLRTVDHYFNKVIEGSYIVSDLEELEDMLDLLPDRQGRQYICLVKDASDGELPADDANFRLLGFDVSDWTMTSSLTNCGLWLDELEPIAQSVNRHGLLTLEAAREAQRILPMLWPGDPHGLVSVWAIYEYAPSVLHT